MSETELTQEQAGARQSRIDLVHQLYLALATADLSAIDQLLDPDFTGQATAGLAAGIGGTHHGPRAMWEGGWLQFGRAADVRVEPAEWIDCEGGRLLVVGTYRGTARRDPALELEADFMHLISFDEDPPNRITSLIQLTDSAAWNPVLETLGTPAA